MKYILNPLFNHFLTGTNQWDPLPDMIEARSDFSAVTYGSSVFAIGGHNGTDRWLGEVEQYNFEEQVWTPYTTLVTPRSGTRCVQTLVTTITTCDTCTGPSCTRTRCTSWAATTAPPDCAQWSASPPDLLAADLCGIR